MILRKACPADLDDIARIEAICFPPAEAASKASFVERLAHYSHHFWLLLEENEAQTAMGYVGGPVLNDLIDDDIFQKPQLHDEGGKYQSVFSLCVLPEYRGNNYGRILMSALIANAKVNGRQGCVLTCKEHLIPYYESMGYVKQGVSKSVHGGAVWYDMLLPLGDESGATTEG